MGFFGRKRKSKPVDQLRPADLATHPVWEYANAEEGVEGQDETWVRPVAELPIADATNRVIGTTVRFSGGREFVATLGNLDAHRAEQTRQFLVLGVFGADGEAFILARYFDAWVDAAGPHALATFMGLPVGEIFPIAYDVSSLVSGDPLCTRGLITLEPEVRLTKKELMMLAMR
jgi:hypothetical protein